MKKTLASLLLATNIMFVSCMEKESILCELPQQDPQAKLYNEILEVSSKSSARLIQLITHMDEIKTQYGIKEEAMASYSYQKWLSKKNYPEAQAVLTCLYLKNYNQQRNTTQENVPEYKNIVKRDKNIGNPLAYCLGLTSKQNFSIPNGAYDNDLVPQHYPAFHTLHNNIQSITIHSPTHEAFTSFITYIYCTNPQKPLNTHIPYRDLKNKFKKTAHNILYIPSEKNWQISPMISPKSYWAIADLCQLIDIIEIGKALNPQKREYDFAYDYHNTSKDNKIVMLCHLIQKYNDQRKTKKSPTSIQIKSYQSGMPIFKCALPDSFDTTLFNKEIYAFDEFTELLNKFCLLRTTSDENVQECINQIPLTRK